MESLKNKIPVITGPTAAGKTELSLLLAEKIGGEIINMDSRQVYRRMDIGTAKPTPEERARVPHHLLDIVEPGARYTVDDFARDSRAAINDITSRGRIPIIIGGTPFYLSALLGGLDFCKVDSDMEYRAELQALVDSEGNKALHDELRAVDPASAEILHENDVFRVIRAMEIHHISGKPASEQRSRKSLRPEGDEAAANNFHICALYMEREKLYDLINLRAGIMFESGLVEETQGLLEADAGLRGFIGSTIGYAQAAMLIEGSMSRPDAVKEASKQTRHFAKRQMTWFRSFKQIVWMDKETMQAGEMVETVAAGIIIN